MLESSTYTINVPQNTTWSLNSSWQVHRPNSSQQPSAKCVRDENCRGEFPPTSPKGLVLVAQTDFCVYR